MSTLRFGSSPFAMQPFFEAFASHPTTTLLVTCIGLAYGCGGSEPASEDPEPATPSAPGPSDGASSGGEGPGPAADPSAAPAVSEQPAPTESAGPAGDTAFQTPSGEVCSRDARLGSFRIYLSEDRTVFYGAVSDGVAPMAIPDVVTSEGDCELLAPRTLVCDSCPSGETCAGDDVCVPSPVKQSVGAVTVTGLASPVTAEPNGITQDYSKSILDPFPGFEVGSELVVAAAGDATEPFALSAWGVPNLVVPAGHVPVARETPVRFEWETTGVDPAQTEVFINFSVNVHGATTGWIECVTADDGAFDIPAALVTRLIDLGLSGFPRAELSRRSVDSAELTTGCVDLRVSSDITVELDVEGLLSCSTSDDCPNQEPCSPERVCVQEDTTE